MTTAVIGLRAQTDVGPQVHERLQRLGPVVRESIDPDLVRLKGVLLAAISDPRFTALVVVGDVNWLQQEALVQQISGLLERRLDAFGQLAQSMLLQQKGADALFTWSCAGSLRGRLLIALPGPPSSVLHLLDTLVVPQWSRLREWATA